MTHQKRHLYFQLFLLFNLFNYNCWKIPKNTNYEISSKFFISLYFQYSSLAISCLLSTLFCKISIFLLCVLSLRGADWGQCVDIWRERKKKPFRSCLHFLHFGGVEVSLSCLCYTLCSRLVNFWASYQHIHLSTSCNSKGLLGLNIQTTTTSVSPLFLCLFLTHSFPFKHRF